MVAIGLAAKTAWEMYTLVGSTGKTLQDHLWTVFWWFIIFVVAVAVAIYERESGLIIIKNAMPIIKLKNFGFEIKQWVKYPPAVCAYIDVYNDPKKGTAKDLTAKNVYARILWVDDTGKKVDENSGRWFYPNEDQDKLGAISLQTVDLGASGHARRLHFTWSSLQQKLIKLFWRADDKKMMMRQHTTSSSGVYKITICLRDNLGATAEFSFRLSLYQIDMYHTVALRIESLDKNENTIEKREFDFNELNKFSGENIHIDLIKDDVTLHLEHDSDGNTKLVGIDGARAGHGGQGGGEYGGEGGEGGSVGGGGGGGGGNYIPPINKNDEK